MAEPTNAEGAASIIGAVAEALKLRGIEADLRAIAEARGDALDTGWLRKWLAPADADKACSLRALSDAELVSWLSQRS